jgi:hypothetical protein
MCLFIKGEQKIYYPLGHWGGNSNVIRSTPCELFRGKHEVYQPLGYRGGNKRESTVEY